MIIILLRVLTYLPVAILAYRKKKYGIMTLMLCLAFAAVNKLGQGLIPQDLFLIFIPLSSAYIGYRLVKNI